jgi:predicted NAD-dependent protein-ADP-ribosyltransferase YbiA (DUF1768 family)
MSDFEDDSPVLESESSLSNKSSLSSNNSSSISEINKSEASTLQSEESDEEEQIIPPFQEIEEKQQTQQTQQTQQKTPIKKQVESKEAKGKRKKKLYQPVNTTQFFKARSKDPKLFTFTADGNLQVPEVDGKPQTVIEIPFYTRMTFEEEEKYEEERRVEIEANEKEFDETLRLLREAIQEWRDTGAISRVGEYQRKLKELDAKRFELRSPIHFIQDEKGVSINEIDFSNRYEKRKVPYEIHMLKLRKFPTQVEYKATTENPFTQKHEEEEEETKLDIELSLGEGEQEKQKEEFTFFNDPLQINGFLSPDSMFRFRYKSTEYNSLIQAYHGERLTRLGKPAIRMLLLKQTTPRGIRGAAAKVTGDLEDSREVFIDILKEYVKSNPDVNEQLAVTEGTTLVYTDVTDTKLGIGLSMDDPLKEHRSNWTGQNILGEAWMAVRNSLDTLEGPPTEGGAPLEIAAAPEDVKRRSGVLMNMYKVKKGVSFA